jgi:hypothetical protein
MTLFTPSDPLSVWFIFSEMYDSDRDLAVEAGLRLWIVFIIAFFLMGLRAELCIFLGAIGGLATWQLVLSWNTDKVNLKPPPKDAPPGETEPSSSPALIRRVFQPLRSLPGLGERRKSPSSKLRGRKPPSRL